MDDHHGGNVEGNIGNAAIEVMMMGNTNTTSVNSAASASLVGNGSMDLDDPLTELTLATPGIGGSVVSSEHHHHHHHRSSSSSESFPAGFWDVMRGVIAREVRDYVSSSFSETPGLH